MKEKLISWLTRLSPVQTETLLNRVINAVILSIVMNAITAAAVAYIVLRLV